MRDIARYALAAIGTDMGVILNHFSAEIAVHGSSVERAATDCLLLVFNTRPSHPPVRRAARTRAGGAKRPLRSTKRPSAKSQKPVASGSLSYIRTSPGNGSLAGLIRFIDALFGRFGHLGGRIEGQCGLVLFQRFFSPVKNIEDFAGGHQRALAQFRIDGIRISR